MTSSSIHEKEDPVKPKDAEANAPPDDVDDITDPEVYAAAIVPQTDDPTTPSLTFRVLLLGIFWCVVLGCINAILSFRTNSFSVSSMVAILISYPAGQFLAKVIPETHFFLFGQKCSLNPGPFSMKEHVLISIMASAGAAGAYGIDNVVVQRLDLFLGNHDIDFIQSLLWVFATQFIGFGIAGLSRRFLVKPKGMLWPGILGTVALFVTLHKPDLPSGRWTMSRYKFFMIAFTAIFVYTWIPEFFLPIISGIAVLCLISSDPNVRFLGSTAPFGGVGIFGLTLNLANIASNNPLLVPFVYTMNNILGSLLLIWILVPGLYYTNAFNSPVRKNPIHPGYPILNTPSLFNRNGSNIKAKILMDTKTFDLNMTAYEIHKPIYLTEYFAVQYLANFLTLAATFSHVALWYGKDIMIGLRKAFNQVNDEEDHHNILMRAYKNIPEWTYFIFLGICIVFMSIVVTTTHFHMPIWAVFLGVGVAAIAILPIGIVEAITGTRIGLNVLSQIIIGLLTPGKTITVMAYKSLGYNSLTQALNLINDLKLALYMKIPPYHMVGCQLIGTLIGAIATTSMSFFVMNNFKLGAGDWSAADYNTFYNAGAIWGAIGPTRFFGPGSVYEKLMFGFLIGFLLPLLPWIGNKLFPHKFWKLIHMPLILYVGGVGQLQNFIIVPAVVGFIFNFYLLRYHNDWWKKYNYVLAAALNGGTSIAALFIPILINLGVDAPTWAGKPATTVDYYCFNSGWEE